MAKQSKVVQTKSTKRPGIHAKSKSSNQPRSKNYAKKYRGQGRP